MPINWPSFLRRQNLLKPTTDELYKTLGEQDAPPGAHRRAEQGGAATRKPQSAEDLWRKELANLERVRREVRRGEAGAAEEQAAQWRVEKAHEEMLRERRSSRRKG